MHIRSYLIIFLTFLLVGGLFLAIQRYGKEVPCKDCSVIVISLDQVRANSLPCFGYSQNTMPNFCQFVSTSQKFTNAYATASRTLDAHFSMITGLYPSKHGMNIPYVSELSRDVPTMAELLKKNGYDTYFMGPKGDPHLPIDRGLGRGFDKTFNADEPYLWVQEMQKIASSSGTGKKSFYFLHTYHAHEPFTPSEEDLRRFYTGPISINISYPILCRYSLDRLISLHPHQPSLFMGNTPCDQVQYYADHYSESLKEYNDIYSLFNKRYWELFDSLRFEDKQTYVHALYSGQLYSLDYQLGEFFSYLKQQHLLEKSVIVIVGDQGDEFGEHGDWSHGWSLYTEVLHIPFVVSIPHMKPTQHSKLISQVDILPTVFSLIGLRPPKNIDGIDIFSRANHRFVISEHVSDHAASLRTDQYSVIRRTNGNSTDWELFDRVKDPGEHTNVYSANPTIAEELMLQYDLGLPQSPTNRKQLPIPTWINEENRKKLIESGYF